jgi:O-antigen ligase
MLRSAAHNDYVRALVEGGIIGAAIFLMFFGIQLLRLFRLFLIVPKGSSQRTFCFILIAFLLALLVGMITENIWSHTTTFFYWFTLSALASWNWNQPELEQPRTI